MKVHLVDQVRSVVVLIGVSQKYKDNPSCSSGEGLSLYFRDIHINTTTNLTWSTRWTGFVLLRHSYQHHFWSHLTYKMDCLCTSETFLSTPLLISPDLQDELSLYFWDIAINTTTDLTWSTRWTVIVLLRHSFWSVVLLIGMSQKYKDCSSCRSGEISSGVDWNVSEVQRQFIV
jgi:hypothetical protein